MAEPSPMKDARLPFLIENKKVQKIVWERRVDKQQGKEGRVYYWYIVCPDHQRVFPIGQAGGMGRF